MRLLVTGANGFVGRAVVLEAARSGWLVRAAVREPARAGRIDGADETVTLDLEGSDPGEGLQDVDAVVHLAARVHVMRDLAADPLGEFRAVNVAGTARLAEAAARAGAQRFVFVSSIKVNGEERDEPYREEDEPEPADAYGRSKLEAEIRLEEIRSRLGLNVCVVRPPLVYGPGVKANFLALLKAVDRGIPLPFSAIHNRRSLIYVENLAGALLLCASDPRASGRTYLVSDGTDFSTPELLRALANALGRPARIWPLPRRVFKVAEHLPRLAPVVRRLSGSLAVDSSRIRRELGWNPSFTATAGFRATAEWFRAANG